MDNIRRPFDLDDFIRSIPKKLEPSGTTINIHVTQNFYGSDSSSGYIQSRGGQGKMKTIVVLTPGEDGYFVAECPALPGCVSQGKTKEEAIENIKEAIEVTIETRRELGLPDFEEIIEVEV